MRRGVFCPTRPTPVNTEVRATPDPDGQPGYLRVDTLHQGDRNGNIRRHCPSRNLTTPYEKLKSLPQAEQYLKSGAHSPISMTLPMRKTTSRQHATSTSRETNCRKPSTARKAPEKRVME